MCVCVCERESAREDNFQTADLQQKHAAFPSQVRLERERERVKTREIQRRQGDRDRCETHPMWLCNVKICISRITNFNYEILNSQYNIFPALSSTQNS